jgi:hypothetical protein
VFSAVLIHKELSELSCGNPIKLVSMQIFIHLPEEAGSYTARQSIDKSG